MQRPERSNYTPIDFAEWKASDTLSLTPKFQRRGVWKPKAKSFFIDTLLRGMPVPPVYIRQTQSQDRTRILREVVDGQQRIGAVLSFMEGGFRLSKSLRAGWAGKTFARLSDDERDRIRSFAFPSEVFGGISDLEVLEVFSRLNTYSVALNAQELRNGRFFGLFKQSCYALGYEHLGFWRKYRVFTEQKIARMAEAEFVSEILVACMDGMQDKKNSIDDFYERHDDLYPRQAQLEKRFRDIATEITLVLGDALAENEFRRPPFLYTLFCVLYHRRHSLPNETLPSPRAALTAEERSNLAEALQELSDLIAGARAGDPISQRDAPFVSACLRQTDNIQPRRIRFKTLYRAAFA